MPDLTSTLQALQAHAWYPAAAGIVTLLLALFRRVAPETWARLPRRWQWVPAVVLAALGAFVDAYASGVSWRIALVLTAYGAVTAGLGAIGLLHAAKRVAGGGEPPDGAVPVTVEPSPSTLKSGGLLFLALLAFGLTGCAGTFEEARLVAASPESKLDVGYCRKLEDRRITWGAVGKGSALLAGASGLATLPVESSDTRLAVGGAALGAGVIAAASVYVSEQAGEAWVRDCSR